MALPYADLMEKFGFIPANHSAPQFFPVAVRKVYDEEGELLDGYVRVVREDTGKTLHIASDGYKLIPNEVAFGAFEEALKKSTLDLADMRVATDYARGGAQCFRQYMLPAHRVEVKPGVAVALRLVMFNSYDGSLSFAGRCGAYNFVCANTSLIGHDLASFKLRHAGEIDVEKAVAGLTKAAEAHVEEARRWKVWPAIPVSDQDALSVFREIPRATRTLVDHLAHRWIEARDGDEKQGGANLWCLSQVLTAWATHGEAQKNADRTATRYDREERVQKALAAPAFLALAARGGPEAAPRVIEGIAEAA